MIGIGAFTIIDCGGAGIEAADLLKARLRDAVNLDQKIEPAIGIDPRSNALLPRASGADAMNGECHAVFVCTGTMMVTPSMVTAL